MAETHPPLSHDASSQEPALEPSIWLLPPSPMTVTSYSVPAVVVVAMMKRMMRERGRGGWCCSASNNRKNERNPKESVQIW